MEASGQNSFQIAYHGSVILFTPLTDEAKDWITDHCNIESWQWMGEAFGVDHRLASSLIGSIQQAGFTIAEDF